MGRDTRRRVELPPSLRALADLASNLWWSCDPEAAALWGDLSRRARLRDDERTPLNPVRVLDRLSARDLEALGRDRDFIATLRRVNNRFRRETARRGIARRPRVAYFSMEFGLHASLPVYAGGLGILAGDHIKTASDLGLPIVGVGLVYREGYFRQEIDRRGHQRVVYPRVHYGELPLEPVRDGRGREQRVIVELPGRGGKVRHVKLRAWRVRVGRAEVYLLDSDFEANAPRDRALSRRLYGGTREDRIAQELLVGIGGVRLLRALGVQPDVWHLNEGHVTFTALERMRELVLGKEALDPFSALEAVASNTVFTTHTPVPEGNEVFDLDLARRYLAPLCDDDAMPVDEFLRLGLDHSPDGRPVLSMTVLAIQVSRYRNGVSLLHGMVARSMWHHLWADLEEDETPIGSVTNGIHVPTWTAPEMIAVFERSVGKSWRDRLGEPGAWAVLEKLPDRELWRIRATLRERLVEFVRERKRRELVREGRPAAAAERETRDLLDPAAFTIGFARRFALYKRADLLFRDVARAARLLNRKKAPVQIIFAGKPHPEDAAGKKLFERVVALSRRKEFRGRVVVLENYDMDVGAALVQGCDLWLNNPVQFQEASGTSGQKAPANLGLNASILDGWWFEGHDDEYGWSFGATGDDDFEDDDRDAAGRDREDATDMLRVLEKEVVPLFYRRGRDGLPRAWLRRVKRSLVALVPRFSSDRMLREYLERYYEPAAENGRRVQGRRCRLAGEIAAWRSRVDTSWPLVHVREVRLLDGEGPDFLEADWFLAGLDGDDVLAESWPGDDHPGAGAAWRPSAVRDLGDGVFRFRFPLDVDKISRVTVRVWPYHPGLPHPAELGATSEVVVE